MLYEATGTVKVVNDPQTFASGFTKREFVITREDERFDADLALICKKERCALLDAIKPGERVKVTFGINSREYNGRYYTDLTALKVEREDSAPAADAEPDFAADVGEPVGGDGDDAMPF